MVVASETWQKFASGAHHLPVATDEDIPGEGHLVNRHRDVDKKKLVRLKATFSAHPSDGTLRCRNGSLPDPPAQPSVVSTSEA